MHYFLKDLLNMAASLLTVALNFSLSPHACNMEVTHGMGQGDIMKKKKGVKKILGATFLGCRVSAGTPVQLMGTYGNHHTQLIV